MSAARRYTYACTLSFGGDTPTAELEIECSFSVYWGQPSSGRWATDSHEAAEPDTVEDIKILTVDGKPWPVDLSYGFMSDADTHEMLVEALEAHEDDMLDAAVVKDAEDYIEARERRAEDMREAF